MAEIFNDLSVIYLTANQLSPSWITYQLDTLYEAIGDYPLITVSRERISYGDINLLDTKPKSHLNMYRQLLRACKEADTPYIATAEDDVLYSKDHFTFYRPPMDTIAYDMARWSLFAWQEKAIYSIKQRVSNCTLIAPRLEYIDALEERLTKMRDDRPELVSEVGRYESHLGVRPRKIETRIWSPVPVVQVNHLDGTDPLQRNTKKRMGQLKAYDIPHWGKASEILKKFNG